MLAEVDHYYKILNQGLSCTVRATKNLVGITLGKYRNAVKAWYSNNRADLHLPPKV